MLYQDFLTNNQRTITKWNHYFPIYERHFKKFQNQSVTFWEIGVLKGGSLQMWKRYLGPFATIIGIDINPKCKEFEEIQVDVCIGDQSDTAFLQSIIDEYGYPDVVLDDGSHIMRHVCATFDFLYDKVSNNGVYMVEDLHTAYRDEYEGGLKREGSFIEKCKHLMDSINARHNGLPCEFANSTFSMSCYDSIIAFEKIAWPKGVPASLTFPQHNQNTINQKVEDAISQGVHSGDVYLYGIGPHTRTLLSELDKDYVSKIKALLTNDNSKVDKKMIQLPLADVNDLKKGDTIIISSLNNQEIINQRLRPLRERGINIVKLY